MADWLPHPLVRHRGQRHLKQCRGQYDSSCADPERMADSFMQVERINKTLQPNMGSGVYLKTWTGTINGDPPTGGGGGSGTFRCF